MSRFRTFVKPEGDTRHFDGFLENGWRRVRKDSTVLFRKEVLKSEKFKVAIGEFVYCEVGDNNGYRTEVHLDGGVPFSVKDNSLKALFKFGEECDFYEYSH